MVLVLAPFHRGGVCRRRIFDDAGAVGDVVCRVLTPPGQLKLRLVHKAGLLGQRDGVIGILGQAHRVSGRVEAGVAVDVGRGVVGSPGGVLLLKVPYKRPKTC